MLTQLPGAVRNYFPAKEPVSSTVSSPQPTVRQAVVTMIEIKRPKDLVRLRRLALAAQGLLQAQPYGRGLAGARKAINHLGYVQIDTISVVERAHHHVFRRSRHRSRQIKGSDSLIVGCGGSPIFGHTLIRRDVLEHFAVM